jgi:glutamate:Na+ symporter, ESS family
VQFFEPGLIQDFLLLGVLLAVAALLLRVVPGLGRLAVPDAILAGVLGLVAGPTVLGWLPFDQDALEVIVYHGLALVFIAIGLQRPLRGAGGGGAASFAFAMPTMAVTQALVGLAVVLGFTVFTATPVSPGFGLLLPLGYQQGPGQALSIGTAWETLGLTDGGRIGLIIAAFGFAWCIAGVPLVAVGRRLGWIGPLRPVVTDESAAPTAPSAGFMEPLTVQVVAVATAYAVVWGLLLLFDHLLAGRPQLAAQLWGFHFILGAGVAIAGRRLLDRLPVHVPLDDLLLSRVASLVVAFTTAAALTAVRVGVLRQWLGPILAVTLLGGVCTLLLAVWLGRRAFPEAPFHHALVLFGASTGTLPTGLALLRILDPELRGPVARNIVVGTTGAIVLGLPLILVVMPLMVGGWASGSMTSFWIGLAILPVYLAALLVGWRLFGPLRFLRPRAHLWPREGAPRAPSPPTP